MEWQLCSLDWHMVLSVPLSFNSFKHWCVEWVLWYNHVQLLFVSANHLLKVIKPLMRTVLIEDLRRVSDICAWICCPLRVLMKSCIYRSVNSELSWWVWWITACIAWWKMPILGACRKSIPGPPNWGNVAKFVALKCYSHTPSQRKHSLSVQW